MGSSVSQNCQRGTVFLVFATFITFFVITVIGLVKNRIDPVEEDQGGEPYKQGEEKKDGQDKKEAEPKKPARKQRQESVQQDSQAQFDQQVIEMKPQTIEEDDPLPVKVSKKNAEFELFYFPFFMLFVVNIVTGTCKGFSLVLFFFTLVVVLLFNVIRVHRQCGNHVCANVVMENLWLILLFFEFINHWGAFTIMMPYVVV